jgi:hypothetical protein
MIIEFIIASALGILFVWMIINLVQDRKLKNLMKKYPEGSVNNSKKVTRLDEVPTVPIVKSEIKPKEVLKELKKLN